MYTATVLVVRLFAAEIDRQYVDPTKLSEVVGWRPAVGLEDGLRRTIEWYRAHPESLAPAESAVAGA